MAVKCYTIWKLDPFNHPHWLVQLSWVGVHNHLGWAALDLVIVHLHTQLVPPSGGGSVCHFIGGR